MNLVKYLISFKCFGNFGIFLFNMNAKTCFMSAYKIVERSVLKFLCFSLCGGVFSCGSASLVLCFYTTASLVLCFYTSASLVLCFYTSASLVLCFYTSCGFIPRPMIWDLQLNDCGSQLATSLHACVNETLQL